MGGEGGGREAALGKVMVRIEGWRSPYYCCLLVLLLAGEALLSFQEVGLKNMYQSMVGKYDLK